MKIISVSSLPAVQPHSNFEPVHPLGKLLQDADRCKAFTAEFDGIFLDYSRQKMTEEVRGRMFELARATMVEEKIKAMKDGEKINTTENRAVMHIALRAPRDASLMVDGENVVPEVHAVLDKIYSFASDVREGKFLGATSAELKNVVSIGIGGSYLGPEFVFEVNIQTHVQIMKSCFNKKRETTLKLRVYLGVKDGI